jgi:ribose-phosphate pyrophosphokinase
MTITTKPYGFKHWKFPGGEIGVKLDPEWLTHPEAATLTATIEHRGLVDHEELFIIMNLCDAIGRVLRDRHKNEIVYLDMPYLPYSRQDRVCHPGESLALVVFLRAIPSYVRLITTDVHSDVYANINSSEKPYIQNIGQNTVAFETVKKHFKADWLVGPDEGSTKKINVLSRETFVPYVTLTKTRKDGKVHHEDLTPDTLSGKVLIVDDICDGGATFISAGQMLRRTQPQITKLGLYVTHGIFSAGLDKLYEVFDTIDCYNDMRKEK